MVTINLTGGRRLYGKFFMMPPGMGPQYRLSKSVVQSPSVLWRHNTTPEVKTGLVDILQVLLLSPVGLDQDAVDGFDADDLVARADRLEHAGEAKVLGAPEDAVG